MESEELNSVFANNYSERVRGPQGELYDEIERIINSEINKFVLTEGRKPILLDIGSAGLLLYNPKNIEKITILDLFPKPDNIALVDNSEWIVGDILSDNINEFLPSKNYDIIIMSSLLHHLCKAENKIIKNLQACFANSKAVLKKEGKIYIFESTCPYFFAKLQDFLFPIHDYLLIKIFKFTHTRMLSLTEILNVLRKNVFSVNLICFKQPKYVTQAFKKVPLKFTTLKIHSVVAFLKEP